ncbi:MAG: TIGR04442 family protein [Nitrospirae bacterium]|nr:TIGR04442 family protein [Nitrospirota bacterium]
MIKDLRLHGSHGPVDFFALVSGADTLSTYFYEEEAARIRFFSRGNEFTVSETGVSYRGTGGSFCEYMFGVEKPLADMEKEDVLNRLIMFGAFMDESERVIFTNDTEGGETFYRLFLQGHAVTNYYFLIASESDGDYKKRQKQVLRAVGKFLKRNDLLSQNKDTELLESFCAELGEQKSMVFIFKLIHRANREYYDAYRNFYLRNRGLTPDEELFLHEIVARNGIDHYQQERMKIDVMYRHPDNKLVVDEYRDILIRGITDDMLDASGHARLNRLRTLSIRNNIPVVLFDTLDDLLLKDKKVLEVEEQEYLKESRAILENLFFKDPSLKQHIIKEDIVRLIRAKHIAYSQNDRGFEQVLLDIGKACDELSRETDDFSVFEEFSSIITYFDRYDNVLALLSQLSFMKNIEFREESLRSLVGNKKEFDRLDGELFRSVFITDLMDNKYITSYGKRKLKLVNKGVENIQNGEASYKDVIADLATLTNEEKLYFETHAALKERMRSFFPGLELKTVRNHIREDIAKELADRGIAAKIPVRLFEKVFLDLRKESVYLNQILPEVILNSDSELREDFLLNSGLDRFYVESLEQEYFEEKALDITLLEVIREGKAVREIGGGERI